MEVTVLFQAVLGVGLSLEDVSIQLTNSVRIHLKFLEKPGVSCARCSKSCGGGIQARTRGVRIQAAHGGANCAGPAKEHGLFLVTGIRQIWLENLKNYTKVYNHIKNKLVCIYIYMYEIVHLHSAAPQLSTRNHFGCVFIHGIPTSTFL